MTATQAATVIDKLREQAECIRNDRPQRFPEAASPGDTFRQGDVYITLLDAVPSDAVSVVGRSMQLVQGTTTGSRHCLDSGDGVTFYRKSQPGMLDGPILLLQKERVITHPEHGHVILPGEGRVYAITYQRNLDAVEREQRVRD